VSATALVTGAGAGIGAATARALAAAGHPVAVTDVDRPAAERVAGQLEGSLAIALDVTALASIESAAATARQSLGPLGVWVSCAGVSSMGPFVELSEAEIDANLAVNTRGAILCGQVAARALIEQGSGGAIVNVASMAAKRGAVPYLAHYVASKFAVVGLTQAMALELAPHGIRVNCVCPGYVETSMQERELAWEAELRGSTIEEVRRLYLQDTPLGRLQKPEDIAETIVFLAQERASSITGEAIAVNGGSFMD
jgi:meso-butanediol dehydrogenase / (S,S)-butanediol dehydrogenase / diacetyl reductase